MSLDAGLFNICRLRRVTLGQQRSKAATSLLDALGANQFFRSVGKEPVNQRLSLRRGFLPVEFAPE